ncbi:MAG: M10 family metallopeptidase C-terminal domain-containing protein, partial [Gammaproteobacteria bacterium]|nr:M10 family metallopeptidase C-terminal domain-containing protein [Gammaproteobacteria bacterium]
IENAVGSSERDYLLGNEFTNVLNGNAGDDVLDGQAGEDVYVGGAGSDSFVFSVIETGDSISDFTTGEDFIDLRATGVAFTFVGENGLSGQAGELAYTDGKLQGDVDGDGVADLEIDLLGANIQASDLAL